MPGRKSLRPTACEALALTLDLALQPATASSNPDAERTASSNQDATRSPLEPPLAGASATGVHGHARAPSEPTPTESRASDGLAGLALRFGLQGTVVTGVAPSALPGAALFVGLGGQGSPSARVAARAAYRASSAANTDLRLALVAGRIEGCPWSWARGRLSLEPCAALDLGVVRAETPEPRGRSDRGPWFSAAAHLRAVFRPAGHFSLEAELGMGVPFVRYRFGTESGSGELFRTEALGAAFALGAGWSVP